MTASQYGLLRSHLGTSMPPGRGYSIKAYEHGTEAPPVQTNRRNGISRKTVKSEDGAFEIEVPRDRDGSFEPRLIPKGQNRIQF